MSVVNEFMQGYEIICYEMAEKILISISVNWKLYNKNKEWNNFDS